ncbi:hypothetical protein BDW60DRAFT_145544 [Aspergillus nidulans var. acristatus]
MVRHRYLTVGLCSLLMFPKNVLRTSVSEILDRYNLTHLVSHQLHIFESHSILR